MSTDPFSTIRAETIREISAALGQGNPDEAKRLLTCHAVKAETIIAAAEPAMRERRWSDAAWFFDQVPHDEGAVGIKRCLSRNLASFQVHRPELYELFVSLPKNDNVGLGTSASGHPTTVCR